MDCLNCPYAVDDKPCNFVAPTKPKAPKLAIVGESPVGADVSRKRPLSGQFGHVMDQIFKSIPLSRRDLLITTATACQKKYQADTQEVKAAHVACRDKLVRDLKDYKGYVLAIGPWAFRQLTGQSSLTKWMGAPYPGGPGFEHLQIIGAPLPSQPPIYQVVEEFTRRAYAFQTGRLKPWEWGQIEIMPDQAALDLLKEIHADGRKGKVIGFDVETKGIDPIHADLMCLSVATTDKAVSIPWDGYSSKKLGDSPPLAAYPLGRVLKQSVLDILADESTTKVMHNCQHDLLTARHKDLPIKGPVADTLIMHHVIYPQNGHDLGFVSAWETHAPRWKSEFRVTSDAKGLDVFVERDPRQLRLYNAKDSMMTAHDWERLLPKCAETNMGWEIYQEYMACSDVALEMRDWGCRLDADALEAHRGPLRKRCAHQLFKFRGLVRGIGRYRFGKNGQHKDLKRLFYCDLNLIPTQFNRETGKPKLDNAALQDIIQGSHGLAAELGKCILNYRKAYKLISTYIDGIPQRDGFINPVWKIYGTKTGRWSSAEPNFQNQPKIMRNMAIPRTDDRWIVAADFSQLELRIIGLLAKAPKLIQWYAEGADVHVKTASGLFQVPEDKVEHWQRQRAKTIEYAFNYNASEDVTTAWTAMVASGDNVSLQELEYFRKMWFQEHPELRKWQLSTLRKANFNKYTEEQMSGKRTYWYDGIVDSNKCLNFPVQAFAGWLMNNAMIALNQKIRWGEEGIVAQVHDAAYLEVTDPHRGARLLEECMHQTVTLHGIDMEFPIDVEVGKNMRDLRGYDANYDYGRYDTINWVYEYAYWADSRKW